MSSYAEIDSKKDVSKFGALDMLFRYVSFLWLFISYFQLDINQYYKVTDYILMLPLDYPDVNVRYVVHPSTSLYSGIGIVSQFDIMTIGNNKIIQAFNHDELL